MASRKKVDRWVSTAQAAKALGVSCQFLLKYRTSLFKRGDHWRVINPTAYRPTYRWNLHLCEIRLDTIDRE